MRGREGRNQTLHSALKMGVARGFVWTIGMQSNSMLGNTETVMFNILERKYIYLLKSNCTKLI